MGLILYLIPIAIYLFYKWATKNNDFFEKQGIAYVKPWPLLGSGFGILFKKQPFVQTLMEGYEKYKHERVFGQFEFRRPAVTVVCPKITKMLAVKEFDHFQDHRAFVKEEIDPIMGNLLTALTGQKWKDMRSTLSPAFTGSKMRQMFDFVSTVGQQTAKTMKSEIKAGKDGAMEFKALALKFTVDVIASCAFGIEVNSFEHPENEFYKIATKVTSINTDFKQIMKFMGFQLSPKLMKFLGITIFEQSITDFFREATLETMKVREEKGIVRQDMINLLMQAQKGQLSHNNNEEKTVDGFATVEESEIGKSNVKQVWNDNELIAQCFIFFFAGFDTVATTMSYLAYELVCNPDIQQKLYEEIQDMENELDGKKISYEKIQGMKYLDQCISETLRKWPIAFMIERACVKDYDLKFDGKVLHFSKGDNFVVPIHCFHHDPQYFPDPEKFDPSRFSEENRKNIDPDTYMPFGVGPRNCIGSRFALMELKTIFYYLLVNFSLEKTEKTQIPFKYENVPMAVKPLNGIWVGLKPRDD